MHGRRVVHMGGGGAHWWGLATPLPLLLVSHLSPLLLPSMCRHRCHLRITATAPYMPLAAALYVPLLPPLFMSHHLPTLGAPASHPLPPCASHPCPHFSGPTTAYLCALPRPAPSPPMHPILHGPICATWPPTNVSRGGHLCHTLDRNGVQMRGMECK